MVLAGGEMAVYSHISYSSSSLEETIGIRAGALLVALLFAFYDLYVLSRIRGKGNSFESDLNNATGGLSDEYKEKIRRTVLFVMAASSISIILTIVLSFILEEDILVSDLIKIAYYITIMTIRRLSKQLIEGSWLISKLADAMSITSEVLGIIKLCVAFTLAINVSLSIYGMSVLLSVV